MFDFLGAVPSILASWSKTLYIWRSQGSTLKEGIKTRLFGYEGFCIHWRCKCFIVLSIIFLTCPIILVLYKKVYKIDTNIKKRKEGRSNKCSHKIVAKILNFLWAHSNPVILTMPSYNCPLIFNRNCVFRLHRIYQNMSCS